MNRSRFGGYDFAAVSDWSLVRAAVESAERQNIPVTVGNLFSADLFYTPQSEMFDRMEAMGILGVEMEAAGLFGVCAEFGAKGAAVCTVSDHIRTGESLPSEDREKGFADMVRVVLGSL